MRAEQQLMKAVTWCRAADCSKFTAVITQWRSGVSVCSSWAAAAALARAAAATTATLGLATPCGLTAAVDCCWQLLSWVESTSAGVVVRWRLSYGYLSALTGNCASASGSQSGASLLQRLGCAVYAYRHSTDW